MKYSRLHLPVSLAALSLTALLVTAAQAEESAKKAGDEQQLETVNVTADSLGSTTEDTNSYTTGEMKTALGMDLSIKETPQSVTVMTSARMEDQGLDEISEVLDQTVGVTFNGTSAVGSDGIAYYSRGFQIKNFQIDGIARPPGIYGFSETTTDMAIYDRVEIVRGSSGLLNGAGSPAATINLVRKKPTEQNRVSVTTQVGSFDNYRLEADVSGPVTPSGNVRSRFVTAYQDSDSFMDRANVDKKVFYGIVEADLTPDTLLTVGAEYQDFTNHGAPRGGVPVFYSNGMETDFSRSTNVGADWSDFNHQTTDLFASLERRFNNGWSVKLDGEESRPDYDETIGYMYTSGFDPLTSAGANMLSARWAGDLTQRIVTLGASGPFQLFGREHELMVGMNHTTAEDEGNDYPGWWSGPAYWAPIPNVWEYLSNGNYPKPYLGPTGSRYGGRIEQEGAYAAVRLKPTDTVSVILGARTSDWEETEWSKSAAGIKKSNTLSKDTGVVTPYAGIVVDLTEEYSAYASYTDIFEPQNYEDNAGNRLPPLEGANYELGVKGALNDGLLNVSAAIFRIEQDNLAVPVPPTPADPFPVNGNGNAPHTAESGTVSKGFELEATGEVLTGWQVGGGYANARAEDSDDKRLLTEIPKDTFKMFSTYNLPGQWQAVTIGGNVRWQSEIYTEGSGPNGEDFAQDSLVLVDLMAKYALTPQLSLALNANNIFDKKYYSGLSWATGTYGEPRSMMLTARYIY